MRFDRHVFGSRSGYTTLAQSDGVSDSERRVLETFAFGQTNDTGYLSSLASQPACISRPLGPRKRAITRVLQGLPDDKGRITLLFPTAILSTADWIKVLHGDAWPLMRFPQLWQWDGAETLERIALAIDGPDRLVLTPQEGRIVLGVLSELERQHATGRSLVLEGSRFAPTVVRTVEMLMPDEVKPEFSSAARSLSANIDVRLNCVARGANIAGAGAGSIMYRPRGSEPMERYAQTLVASGLMNGTVPWDVIRGYDEFGERVLTAADTTEGFQVQEGLAAGRVPARGQKALGKKAKLLIALAGFLVVAGAVLGIGVYRKAAAASTRDALAQRANSFAEIPLSDFLLRTASQQDSLLADAKELEARIGRDAEIDRGPLLNLQAWISRQTALRDASEAKDRMLRNVELRLRGHRPPDAPDEQIAPEKIDEIQRDLKEAKSVEQKLTASIEGHMVDLSPRFQSSLRQLEDLSERLRANLARRENAFQVFAQKLQRAIRTRDPARANELSQEWRKKWEALVKADKAKADTLEGLHKELTDVGGRPARLEAMRKSLAQTIGRLRAPAPGGKENLAELTRACRQAEMQAKAYPELMAEVEEIQRALGMAQERLLPAPDPPAAQVEAARATEQLELLAGIGHKLAELLKNTPQQDWVKWSKDKGAVEEDVKRLEGLSKSLGDATAVLVARCIQAEETRPRPQPPVVTVEYMVVTWGIFEPLAKHLGIARNLLGKMIEDAKFKVTTAWVDLVNTLPKDQKGNTIGAGRLDQLVKDPPKDQKAEDQKLRELTGRNYPEAAKKLAILREKMRIERNLESDVSAIDAYLGACGEVKAEYQKAAKRN